MDAISDRQVPLGYLLIHDLAMHLSTIIGSRTCQKSIKILQFDKFSSVPELDFTDGRRCISSRGLRLVATLSDTQGSGDPTPRACNHI